jgi:hypothetical protein
MAKRKLKVKKEVSAKKSRARVIWGRVAFGFACLSVFILLINGLLIIFAGDFIMSVFLQIGVTVSKISLITYGIIWLILAVMTWVTALRVQNIGVRSEKWLLFVLGVITAVTGRLESGFFTAIAGVIYLLQK